MYIMIMHAGKGMTALITPHERLWVLGHRCTDQESLRPFEPRFGNGGVHGSVFTSSSQGTGGSRTLYSHLG